ncbi:S8 family peptidase [uncultured Acetatifactor sp.]|uniref:S8 family peptidase n=1 Tax=uncultured Acetatifactor sp. TaxID=1671927 RepID=UPI002609A335|nr:S8 family peptidase [uncultured Acetatifactor sp.]
MNQKLEDILQLALQTPEQTRALTEELNVGFDTQARTWELIVKYHGSLETLKALGIEVEYLIAGYAVLTVPEQFVDRMVELEEIEYVEMPKRYFYDIEMPTDNSCIAQVTLRHPNLSGAGILVAVLDSGIDYKLPEFRKSDGSTRIRFLWDQTLQPEAPAGAGTGREAGGSAATDMGGAENAAMDGTQDSAPNAARPARRPPAGYRLGVEFDSAQINQALAAPAGQRQYELLPSIDSSGHGTAVAGIAAGDSPMYQGVAPEAELLIVKLGLPDASSFPRTTEIMRAVTYAIHKAIELRMPLVINLSFGNTYGAHDGSSLIERFLDNAAEIGRTVICVGSGNEGNSGGHLAGSLLQEDDIAGGRPGAGIPSGSADGIPSRIGPIARPVSVELAVADYERTLNVQLWKNYCDTYRIFLRSPGGQETQLPEMINGGKYTLTLEQTQILVYFGKPAPYAVAEEIYFEMLPEGRNYINSGVWTIRLEPLQVVTGRYYFYLPSAVVRAAGTGFYQSTPEVTLTIPSTAAKVISVGAYDSTYEAYADFSGRGYADANRTIGVVAAGLAKPDLAAPGVGILAPDIYGGYRPVTGTSFATPIVAGSCALLMEWGIVRGNDVFLYGEKVKAYLRAGARALRGETAYPNSRVGWGGLCVSSSLPT